MRQNVNLQDMFLNKARKENVDTIICLLNGDKLEGIVKGFDNYTIILQIGEKQQLIYKHAVATIIPINSMNLND